MIQKLLWFWGLTTALQASEKRSQGFEAIRAEMRGRLNRVCEKKGEEKPEPQSRQYLNLAISDARFENFNPYCVTGTGDVTCLGQIFEGLLIRDSSGKIQGGCAEHWEYNPTDYTWTFRLRSDLKWNNGEPLLAKHFVNGVRAHFDPTTYPHQVMPKHKPGGLLKFWNLEGAEAVLSGQAPLEALTGVWAPDARTLKLKWTHAVNPEVTCNLFIAPSCVPLYPGYLEATQKVNSASDIQALVTNGPFKLNSLIPRTGFSFKKNPYFWAAKNVRLEEVNYLYFNGEPDVVEAWQNGKIDISDPLTSKGLQQLKPADYGFLSDYTSGSLINLEFNLKSPKLADRRVRQAINMALDREALEAHFILPPRAQLYGILETEGGKRPFRPAWSEWSIEKRREEARKLLKSCKFDEQNKLKLKLSVAKSYEDLILKPLVTQFRWAFEGIAELEAEVCEPRVFSMKRSSGDYELTLDGFYSIALHPFSWYLGFYHGEHGNLSGFYNPRYDQAILDFQAVYEPKASMEVLERLEKLLWSEVPFTPLFANAKYSLVNENVGGWASIHRSPISTAGIVACRYLFRKSNV